LKRYYTKPGRKIENIPLKIVAQLESTIAKLNNTSIEITFLIFLSMPYFNRL